MKHMKQKYPALVALYDIPPGNGVGQFLQPRSPHGAYLGGQFRDILWETIFGVS